MLVRLRRGAQVDSAVAWLKDKPLPEDGRWPAGAVLSDVVEIYNVGNAVVFDPGAATGGRVGADAATAVLAGEVDDAITIHEAIGGQLDGDERVEVAASLRVLRRLRATLPG